MDKISIDVLSSNQNYGNSQGNLDVYSICSKTDNNEKFNVQNLIQTRNDRRQKLLDFYVKIYKICLEKINRANSINKTDIVFEVPDLIFECADYSSAGCLEFIENKLRGLYIDTYKLSRNAVFISWLYIEINMKTKSNVGSKSNFPVHVN